MSEYNVYDFTTVSVDYENWDDRYTIDLAICPKCYAAVDSWSKRSHLDWHDQNDKS